jgi:hypothetical protein
MTTTQPKVSKTRSASYLGRRVRSTTVGSQGIGERVSIIEHVDAADPRNGGHAAGTWSLTHLRGDGRTTNCQVFAELLLPVGTTQAEAVQRATELLAK